MGEAGLGSGPPGKLEGDADRIVFLATTSKISGQSPQFVFCLPRACSPRHPEPLRGRFCARAASKDPFLSREATRPRGVHRRDQKQTQTFSTIQKLGTTHQRGKQTQLRASPTARHPNTAVWTRTSGTKGQEKLPNAQAQLPRGKGYLHQLPISEIWSPQPKQGEQGRVKLGTGETMRPGCPAGPEQRGPGDREPSPRPLTGPAVFHPQKAVAARRGCHLGRKLEGHLRGGPGAPLGPQGRCWWWWVGWGQTRDTRHTWTTVTDKTSP